MCYLNFEKIVNIMYEITSIIKLYYFIYLATINQVADTNNRCGLFYFCSITYDIVGMTDIRIHFSNPKFETSFFILYCKSSILY